MVWEYALYNFSCFIFVNMCFKGQNNVQLGGWFMWDREACFLLLLDGLFSKSQLNQNDDSAFQVNYVFLIFLPA